MELFWLMKRNFYSRAKPFSNSTILFIPALPNGPDEELWMLTADGATKEAIVKIFERNEKIWRIGDPPFLSFLHFIHFIFDELMKLREKKRRLICLMGWLGCLLICWLWPLPAAGAPPTKKTNTAKQPTLPQFMKGKEINLINLFELNEWRKRKQRERTSCKPNQTINFFNY